MNVKLFFEDDGLVFGMKRLRDLAQAQIENSRLVLACGAGDPRAIRALHVGFWPFVNEFEKIIDRRKLPLGRLRTRFGRPTTHGVLAGLQNAVAEMQKEEQSHAAHWKRDAECFGIQDLSGEAVPEVSALIGLASGSEFSDYFAVLAGTEFIAEELSAYLVGRQPFVEASTRSRWMWGEIHLMHHDHGPSHLEIDLDLARALEPQLNVRNVESAVEKAMTQFGTAANDVYERLYAAKVAAE